MDEEIKAMKERIAWLDEQNKGLRNMLLKQAIKDGSVKIHPFDPSLNQYGLGMTHLVTNTNKSKAE